MALYRERGVVLRTYKLGEADRIVSFVTEHRGKVRAVAKGVRKTKSRFGGRLEPTSHLQIQFYEGRGDLDIVTQAETITTYRKIREDLDRFAKAVVLLEAVDQLSQEGQAAPQLYRMLVGALSTLDDADSALIVPAFLLKLLALEGFSPTLDRCVIGGETGSELVAFDVARGGAVCVDHRRGRTITPEALAVMRAILGGGLSTVLEVPMSSVTHEVDALVARLYEYHLERRLRSPHVLDRTQP
jgi:DNA repair protein RecO (recombination protein O)